MKRSESHKIEDQADRLLRSLLSPDWVIRNQDKDYGIDYEMEYFNNNKSTGIIFKIQSKGKEQSDLSHLYHDMPMDNLEYYIEQVQIPVFIFLCCIDIKDVFYQNIQGNQLIEEDYYKAKEKKQKNLRIKFDSNNSLSNNPNRLIEQYQNSKDYLVVKQFCSLDYSHLIDIKEVRIGSNKYDTMKSIEDKTIILEVNNFYTKFNAGQYEDAYKVGNELIKKYAFTPTSIFLIEILDKMYVIEFKSSGNKNYHDFSFKYMNIMKVISKNWDKQYRLYAYVMFYSEKMYQYIDYDFNSYMNQSVTRDELYKVLIGLERERVLKIISKYIRVTLDLIKKSTEYDAILFSKELFQFASCLFPLTVRIKAEMKNFKIEDNFFKSYEDLLKTAIELNEELKNYDGYIQVSALLNDFYFMFNKKRAYDYLNETKLFINKNRPELLPAVDHMFKSNDEHMEIKNDIEIEKDIYLNFFKINGINIHNPTNDIDRICKIGFDDLNPERVLKKCVYRYVTIESVGAVAEMLALRTAGSKALHCVKLQHSIMSVSLDSIDKSFTNTYCKGCEYLSPHDENWKWNYEWQQKQDSLYHEKYFLLPKLNKR